MALGIGIREGYRTITRNNALFVLSLLVTAIAFFLLSLFGLITVNLYRMVGALEEKIEIIAFLDENADSQSLIANISKIRGVEDVTYVSAAQALEDLQREMEDTKEILGVFAENPLPASLRIKLAPALRNVRGLKEISAKVLLFNGVSETIYGGELVDQLKQVTDVVTIFDLGLLIIIMLSVIFVIFQTIKLTIVARSAEIEIMRLVGASNSFIVIPFVFEGMIQGMLGGLMAFLLTLLVVRIGSHFLAGVYFPQFYFLLGDVICGVVFGIIGATMALRKFLK